MNLETKIKLYDPHGYYGTPFRFWINRNFIKYVSRYCPSVAAHILDIGCGEGEYGAALNKTLIQGQYLGVDIRESDNWNRITGAGRIKFRFRQFNAEAIGELGERFNFIYAITSFEHFENEHAVIKGAFQILGQGHFMIIIVPSHYSYLLYGKHGHRRYSRNSIRSLSESAGFKIITLKKIGGGASYFFHLLWRWTSQVVKYGFKAILILLFAGNKNRARQKLPKLFYYLDGLMFIHILSKPLRRFHKCILQVCHRVDQAVPVLESGYLCILKK